MQAAVTGSLAPSGPFCGHGRTTLVGGGSTSSLKSHELVHLHIVVTCAAIVFSGHDELDRVLARAQLLREHHVGVECVVIRGAPMGVDRGYRLGAPVYIDVHVAVLEIRSPEDLDQAADERP